jgi:quinol monooxygenase YgiN
MTFAQEVKRDLQDNVFFIVEATIKPEQFDNFLKVAEHMSEVVIGEEPGAFNYEWTINSDSSKCFILERYANSTATLDHMKLFRAQFAEKFYGVLEVTGFTLYGNPGPEVLEGLGVSEGAVRKKVAGFAR